MREPTSPDVITHSTHPAEPRPGVSGRKHRTWDSPLRGYGYAPDAIKPPVAFPGWPEPLEYDAAMARGADQVTLPLFVVVGRVNARSTRDALAAYLEGTGAKSVKAAVEAGTYTAFDSVRVQSATVDAVIVAGIEYLGATFQLDIIGQGGA